MNIIVLYFSSLQFQIDPEVFDGIWNTLIVGLTYKYYPEHIQKQ